MLIGMDEYPYHQITSTFAGVAGTDPAWNDGHYICLSDMAGQIGLASTLRLYQNNDVLDGFVCLRHAGRQHNIRLSRRLRPHMDELVVGPLRLEILEPMRTVRLVLEDNEHGITADVTCRLTDADGVPREYTIEDLGWVYTQGGGYFGGFDDGLGQGVYRGDYHVEGEVWDVSHPTRIIDSDGRSFEFDHAWAENFTRLTCDGQRGLAHYECVVITEAQEWTANPGRRPS